MKKAFLVILSILLLGFFVYKGFLGSSAMLIKKDIIKITTDEIKAANQIITIDIKVPVIQGIKDSKLKDGMNNEIKKEMMGFHDDVFNAAKTYYEEANKHGWHMTPYEAYSDYFVSYNKNGILSITVELYSYTGGAHGNTRRISFNFDTKKGESIALCKLFKEGYDYEKVMNEEIEKEIKKDSEGMYFEGAFLGIKKNQPYYLTEAGIVIYFDLYEIAPYAAGIPEFLIPFTPEFS